MCSQLPQDSPQEWGYLSVSEIGTGRVPKNNGWNAVLGPRSVEEVRLLELVVGIILHFGLDPDVRLAGSVACEIER